VGIPIPKATNKEGAYLGGEDKAGLNYVRKSPKANRTAAVTRDLTFENDRSIKKEGGEGGKMRKTHRYLGQTTKAARFSWFLTEVAHN